MAPADLATSPYSKPDTAIATHHPMTVGRTIRMARPVGPDRSRRWGGLVERSGTMLAPTSRRPARPTAMTAAATVKHVMGTRARGWGEVSGWSSSTQPRGEAQMRPWRPTPASAIILTA